MRGYRHGGDDLLDFLVREALLAEPFAGQKVFDAPGTLPLVSVEVPDGGVLLSCAQKASS